jgi:hypothetical protein
MDKWLGYVELNNEEGISTVEFRRDEYDGKIYVNVWVDGDLADQIESLEDFEHDYGKNLYLTLRDYRNYISISAAHIWRQIENGE